MNKWNPGEIAPKSGTYKVVDKNGKAMYTVEMQKDKRLNISLRPLKDHLPDWKK